LIGSENGQGGALPAAEREADIRKASADSRFPLKPEIAGISIASSFCEAPPLLVECSSDPAERGEGAHQGTARRRSHARCLAAAADPHRAVTQHRVAAICARNSLPLRYAGLLLFSHLFARYKIALPKRAASRHRIPHDCDYAHRRADARRSDKHLRRCGDQC
jgi:hypothetical protein